MPSVDIRLTGSVVDRRSCKRGNRERRGDGDEAREVEEAVVAGGDTASDDITVCVGDITVSLARVKVSVEITIFQKENGDQANGRSGDIKGVIE
jgi:hypothetical protein